MPRDARDNDRRTALDEILAKGRTKTRQERWVVLGRMKKYESSPVTMPTKPQFHPGIITHAHPTFQNRTANAANLPDLPLRFAFVGTSGSGKGVCMLDLLLRHYRGALIASTCTRGPLRSTRDGIP